MKLGADFRKLWFAHAASSTGVAATNGIFTLLAVSYTQLSSNQVAWLLAACGFVAGVASLPVGPWVERSRERPFLVAADVVRAFLLGILVVVYLENALNFIWLLAISVGVTTASVVFSTASGAHLRDLVPEEKWGIAISRLESIGWVTTAGVTPLAGAATSHLGPSVVLLTSVCTYLVSVVFIRLISRPEPVPEYAGGGKILDISGVIGGWRYLLADSHLRRLFINAMCFGGALAMSGPLVALFILRELEFSATVYGLILGVPAVAGFLGAAVSVKLGRLIGSRRSLFVFGVLRGSWIVLIPFAPQGAIGVVYLVSVECLSMFFCGLFNPVFATYRMKLVERQYFARVSAAWPISALLTKPLFIVVGGFLATVLSVQAALMITGAFMLAIGFVLPARTRELQAADKQPAQPPPVARGCLSPRPTDSI